MNMESITPTMPLSPMNTQTDGGGSWIWFLLIFLLLGGRNAFGGGADVPTNGTNPINNEFLYTQQKADALGQSITNQATQISSALCQGFGEMRMGMADLGFRLAECCCTIQKDIQSVNAQSIQNTCDITNAINASNQSIKDLINANTMQDLRDDRERWREMFSQANQTNTISELISSAINQRFPYPAPANVVGFGYPGFAPAVPFQGGCPPYNPCCCPPAAPATT